MDGIQTRIALNEALFREVNENIQKVSEEGRYGDAHFVCECGEAGCEERVAFSMGAYRAVREHPLHFFVKPGHESPHAEKVVERHEGYLIVEKPPEAAPLLSGETS